MSEMTTEIATPGRIVTEEERGERFKQLVKDIHDVYRKHLGISEIMPLDIVEKDGTYIGSTWARYLTVCGLQTDRVLCPTSNPTNKDSSIDAAEEMLEKLYLGPMTVSSTLGIYQILNDSRDYEPALWERDEQVEHQV